MKSIFDDPELSKTNKLLVSSFKAFRWSCVIQWINQLGMFSASSVDSKSVAPKATMPLFLRGRSRLLTYTNYSEERNNVL